MTDIREKLDAFLESGAAMRRKFIKCATLADAFKAAPWAIQIVKWNGGYMAFASRAAYETWRWENQRSS